MTTKLKWRLGKLPSPDEVRELVKDKIITHEEARDILFNAETEEERDTKSLKEEIKFLRETIENLTKNNRSQLIETIRYIEKPYLQWHWYQPYMTYCSNNGLVATSTSANYLSGSGGVSTAYAVNAVNAVGTSWDTTGSGASAGGPSFTDIQTF